MDDPKNLADAIELACKFMINSLWTACPAEVLSYNAETKRAQVQPLPMVHSVDGGYYPLPVINNVPVVWPAGGGFVITAPIKVGDSVMLVFSRRGISNFKIDFKAPEPSGGVMAMDAAVAFPCFGSMNVTPSDGISMQTEDGEMKVEVLEDSVVIKAKELGGMTVNADGSILFKNGAMVTADGDFVTAGLISLNTHLTTAVTRGGEQSGPPVSAP